MACFIITIGDDKVPGSHYFLELARSLVDRSHRVIIIMTQRSSPGFECDPRLQVLHWPSPRPTKWADFTFISRLLKVERPQCVVGNFGAVNVLTIAAWLHGVPSRVAWYRTLSSQLDADHALPGWKRWLLRKRKRLVYALATHIVANSQAAMLDVHQVYSVPLRKCRYIHFLLSDPNLSGIQRDPSRIVCVGRLNPSKGQEIVIRAMALLRDSCPSAYVEFVGDGPERERLVELARSLDVADRCRFLGRRPSREVLEILASAAVAVVPSRNEAFGWVNVEALSVGTPVVATMTDGISDVILEGETGYLVARDDVGAFSDRIQRMTQDEGLRSRLSSSARIQFQERFYLQHHIGRHADFIEEIAGLRENS